MKVTKDHDSFNKKNTKYHDIPTKKISIDYGVHDNITTDRDISNIRVTGEYNMPNKEVSKDLEAPNIKVIKDFDASKIKVTEDFDISKDVTVDIKISDIFIMPEK
jgi:hypothetical protein